VGYHAGDAEGIARARIRTPNGAGRSLASEHRRTNTAWSG
jgi:hypothetical protein